MLDSLDDVADLRVDGEILGLGAARVGEPPLVACLELRPVGLRQDAPEVLGLLRGAEDGQPVARLGREMLAS